jgi:hypothetical protein
LLPIGWDAPFRTGHGLVKGMVSRRGERRTSKELVGAIVIKPIFARLKARNNGVFRPVRVLGRVLSGRGVATSDMTALGAAPEMEPPASRCFAFNATGAAWWGRRIDGLIGHMASFPRHQQVGRMQSIRGAVRWPCPVAQPCVGHRAAADKPCAPTCTSTGSPFGPRRLRRRASYRSAAGRTILCPRFLHIRVSARSRPANDVNDVAVKLTGWRSR